MTPWPSKSNPARAVLAAALQHKPSERVAFIEGACVDNDALRDEVLELLDSSDPALQLPPDRVGRIVGAALERPRNERLVFVEGACAGDEALRVRALALLVSLDTADPPAVRIVKPVERAIAPDLADEPTRIGQPARTISKTTKPELSCEWRPGQTLEGRRVGPYQLLHSLGKGGMGSVYAASRADQEYKKIVAIKLVTSGLGTEEMLRRFRNERQVLAGLDHPHIARLLDGGSTEDGLPYLVMEYVEGLPVDRYCESNHFSLTERLKLFQKICSAVQYAHQNLVVHRDIKPGNILVGTNAEPKLLDFGIARLMTAEFSAEEIELNRGEIQPMTLRYASPEQVRGEPITTESDIYSLGVLLYELVAGEHPFQDALTGRAEIEKAILTRAPQEASIVVLRRAEAQSDKRLKHASRKLSGQLRGEIDPILLTALAKQPRGRYPSAESFSLDITRYLNGFPVSPRRDEVGYRARKSIRRHALGFITAAVVGVALIASTIVSARFAQTAHVERLKAQSRFDDVRKLAHFVLFDFDDKIRAGPTAARKLLVTEARDYLNRLAKDTSGDASLERELIDGYIKVGDLEGNPNVPNLGDAAAAKESFSQALQVAEALRSKNPKDSLAQEYVARANVKLGDLSEYSGNPTEALKSYRAAQTILEPLIATDPAAKASLVTVYGKIGTVQLQLGDNNSALNSFQRDLQIAQELFEAKRDDPRAHRRVALAYDKLGETMARTGAVSEGLEKLNTARTIYDEMAASNPASSARSDLARVDMVIGTTLANAGKQAEAVQSYRQSLKIIETLAAEDPKNTEYKRNLHVTLGRLADALAAAGKTQEARQATERALQVLRPMVDAPGASDYDIYQYCWLLLTTPLHDLRAPMLARHYAEQLVKSSAGKDPNTLDLLARAYDGAGDSARAVLTESNALALLPPNSASDLRAELEKNLANFRARAQRQHPQ